LEQVREIGADALRVVDDEHARAAAAAGGARAHHAGAPTPAATRGADSLAAGSVKAKRLPPPGRGSTPMRPPWASTMRRQMASPRPSPPALRRSPACT